MIAPRKTRSAPQWKVRFVVYKRGDSFEVEALNAGGAGVGETALKAMDAMIESLLFTAVVAHEEGLAFTVKENAEDKALFEGLKAGDVPPDVSAFGELTIGLRKDGKAEVAQMRKMELVGGIA